MNDIAQQPQHPPFRILFLCTGNSARSILAEYLMRKMGKGKFKTFSAGSHPSGKVNTHALRVLEEMYQIDASDARSKSWNEFLVGGPDFDFVITVCDSARETCPVFPGHPITAHWGTPDPAVFQGNDRETFEVFAKAAMQIHRRLDLFCSLPFEKLDALRMMQMTREIGQSD